MRVGVAASDPHRVLASPLETVPAPGLARVAALVAPADHVRKRRRFSTSLRFEEAATAAVTVADSPVCTSSRTIRSLDGPTNGTSRRIPSSIKSTTERSMPAASAFAARL